MQDGAQEIQAPIIVVVVIRTLIVEMVNVGHKKISPVHHQDGARSIQTTIAVVLLVIPPVIVEMVLAGLKLTPVAT